MTTAQTVGAVSDEAAKWYAIDWPIIHRNVRRLQVRIAQATKERRWGKVQALQRLLTHSYSGKVFAVRRVTENTGKKPLVWTKKFGAHRKRRHRQYMHSSEEVINRSLSDAFTSRNRTAKRCARSEFPL